MTYALELEPGVHLDDVVSALPLPVQNPPPNPWAAAGGAAANAGFRG